MRTTVRSEGDVDAAPGPAQLAVSPRSRAAIQRVTRSSVRYFKNSLCSALVSGHNTRVAGKANKKSRMDAVKLLPEVIRRLLAVSDPDLLLHEVCALASDALG